MQRPFLIFIFLFFIFSPGAAQQNLSKKAQETLDPYLWDFGRVKEGTASTHNFVFKNTANKILNITEAHTSCGCTGLDIKKKRLLPQEETPIEVRFNSQGYSGPVEQYIYVNTDSLDNPVVRLIIRANVVS
jgi:hypothetical protein